jgi:Transposase DDE domain
MLDRSNTSSDVWADSAYRSAEIEAKLKAEGYKSRIHRRGHRNHPLSERETAANTTRSRIRARVEHVFGHQENSMGRKLVEGGQRAPRGHGRNSASADKVAYCVKTALLSPDRIHLSEAALFAGYQPYRNRHHRLRRHRPKRPHGNLRPVRDFFPNCRPTAGPPHGCPSPP